MMSNLNVRTNDTAVSESIGFLLIFSMVIVGIGLVTLYGYPMLLREQSSADVQIMQKSMIVLQNDLKSLTFKTVPYKETMLNTGAGQLVVNQSLSYRPSFTIRDTGTGPIPVATNFRPGEIRFSSNSADTVISLQNGAVVSRKLVEPGSVMFAQPRWFHDETTNTMVVNLISFNSSYNLAKHGVADVQMRINQTNYTVISPTTGDICLAYSPDTSAGGDNYEMAWDTYFVSTMKMVKNGGACNVNEYRLPVNAPGTLVIKKYDVDIASL
jgi:hypothetical protein